MTNPIFNLSVEPRLRQSDHISLCSVELLVRALRAADVVESFVHDDADKVDAVCSIVCGFGCLAVVDELEARFDLPFCATWIDVVLAVEEELKRLGTPSEFLTGNR